MHLSQLGAEILPERARPKASDLAMAHAPTEAHPAFGQSHSQGYDSAVHCRSRAFGSPRVSIAIGPETSELR